MDDTDHGVAAQEALKSAEDGFEFYGAEDKIAAAEQYSRVAIAHALLRIAQVIARK